MPSGESRLRRQQTWPDGPFWTPPRLIYANGPTFGRRRRYWPSAPTFIPVVRHHQNMAMSSVCSICRAEDSWRHTLIECTMLCCVWALANEETTQHICISAELIAKQCLFLIMEMLDNTLGNLLCTMPANQRQRLAEPIVHVHVCPKILGQVGSSSPSCKGAPEEHLNRFCAEVCVVGTFSTKLHKN
jgi:hypothetical protein